jgi:hypothetical protein
MQNGNADTPPPQRQAPQKQPAYHVSQVFMRAVKFMFRTAGPGDPGVVRPGDWAWELCVRCGVGAWEGSLVLGMGVVLAG